ncbi:MAG: DALR anticodon-binding domain-containing protein, partial [Bradymonadaceae bacterium]
GPYCLYTYARVQSIGREIEVGWPDLDPNERDSALDALGTDREMAVVRQLGDWPTTVEDALQGSNPSDVTEYLFELAQAFSSLYNDPDHRIVDLDAGPRRDGLLLLCRAVAETMETGLELLGIETLDEM